MSPLNVLGGVLFIGLGLGYIVHFFYLSFVRLVQENHFGTDRRLSEVFVFVSLGGKNDWKYQSCLLNRTDR